MVVLFVMSTLSLVALGISYRATLEIRLSNQRAVSERLHMLGHSVINAELNELATRTDDFDHPAQPWASPASWDSQSWFQQLMADKADLENYAISFNVCDEESKLNVHSASSETLERFGLNIQQISDLMDWMTPGETSLFGGAKSSYYRQLEHPYQVKGEPPELFNELLMVRGFNLQTMLGDFAYPSSTSRGLGSDIPYHGLMFVLTTATDGINLNTASRPVLETLPISVGAVGQILAYRRFDSNSSGNLQDHAFRGAADIDQLQGLTNGERSALRRVAVFKSHHFTIMVRVTHKMTGLTYCVRAYAVDGEDVPTVLQWDVVR